MKTILAVLLLGAFSVHAAEGFGAKKAVVSMTRSMPPAVSVPASTVKVTVTAQDAKDVDPLRRAAEQVVARDAKFTSGPDVQLAFVVDRIDVEEKRLETSARKSLSPRTTSTEGVLPQGSMPGTRRQRGIVGEITGTYRITDANGKLLGGGRFGEKLDDWGVNATEARLRAGLLERAGIGVASALHRTNEDVPVLLPRGSFESLIPLAEANQWDRYLAAVEAMPPMNTLADEAYRQYALGIAKEAVAYTADRDRALTLLREAVEHHLSAIEENPNEPLFKEPETIGETTVLPALKRVTASAKAYAAWRP